MLDRFKRPVHAVVQGASGGIGAELVRQLLEERRVHWVTATCRQPEQARNLRALQALEPQRLSLLPLDVCDESSIEVVAGALRDSPPVDLILNASGFLWDEAREPEKRLGDVESGGLERAFRVNTFGPMMVLKHLVPLMPRRDHTVVASLSARVGSITDNRLGGWYSYRASKAALNMLHRTLAVELARSHPGCACVVLHPGTVDTGLSKPFQKRVPADKLFEPVRAARQLLAVVDSVDSHQTGSFLDWDNQTVPW